MKLFQQAMPSPSREQPTVSKPLTVAIAQQLSRQYYFRTMSDQNPPRSALQGLSGLLFSAYQLTVMVAIPQYSWRDAREHGFMGWLMLGEFRPVGKALIWPFYDFQREGADQGSIPPPLEKQLREMAITTFLNASNASQQATFIIRSAAPEVPLAQIPSIDKAINYGKQALASADVTDEANLYRLYPELGTQFKKEFREAMRCFLAGLQNGSIEDLHKFKQLNDSWRDWNMAIRKGIEAAVNAPG
jgi:hypothetical protein